MAKNVFFAFGLLMLLAGGAFAQDSDEGDLLTLNGKSQFGIRLGTWINAGDDPPELLTSDDEFSILETNISSVNAYFEGYYAHSLFPQTFREFSVGIVNRGSVTVQEGNITDIGNLVVYPFLLHLKFYPLSMTASKIQPYVTIGGGLYYGRQDIQFTNLSDFYLASINGESETDFNYALSGGADYILSDKIALDFSVKYMPINFSKSLITVQDYGAVAATVGIKYLYGGK